MNDANVANKNEWERPLPVEEIRRQSTRWTLAADAGLLLCLRETTDRFLACMDNVTNNINSLNNEAGAIGVQLENTENVFAGLSNSQFLENRVYDDEPRSQAVAAPTQNQEKTKEEREMERISVLKNAIENGFTVLDSHFTKIDIGSLPGEEIDETFQPEPVYEAKDPYASRALPHIIGTAEFLSSQYIGLRDEEEAQLENDADVAPESDDDESVPVNYAVAESGDTQRFPTKPVTVSREDAHDEKSETDETSDFLGSSPDSNDLFPDMPDKTVPTNERALDKPVAKEVDFRAELSRKLMASSRSNESEQEAQKSISKSSEPTIVTQPKRDELDEPIFSPPPILPDRRKTNKHESDDEDGLFKPVSRGLFDADDDAADLFLPPTAKIRGTSVAPIIPKEPAISQITEKDQQIPKEKPKATSLFDSVENGLKADAVGPHITPETKTVSTQPSVSSVATKVKDVPAPSFTLPKAIQGSSLFDDEDDDDDIFSFAAKRKAESLKQPSRDMATPTNPVKIASGDVEIVQDRRNEQIVKDSKPVNIVEHTVTVSKIDTKPTTHSSLFGDESDDDLFSFSKKSAPKAAVQILPTERGDAKPIQAGVPASTVEKKEEVIAPVENNMVPSKSSLFDDADDDLFSEPAIPAKMPQNNAAVPVPLPTQLTSSQQDSVKETETQSESSKIAKSKKINGVDPAKTLAQILMKGKLKQRQPSSSSSSSSSRDDNETEDQSSNTKATEHLTSASKITSEPESSSETPSNNFKPLQSLQKNRAKPPSSRRPPTRNPERTIKSDDVDASTTENIGVGYSINNDPLSVDSAETPVAKSEITEKFEESAGIFADGETESQQSDNPSNDEFEDKSSSSLTSKMVSNNNVLEDGKAFVKPPNLSTLLAAGTSIFDDDNDDDDLFAPKKPKPIASKGSDSKATLHATMSNSISAVSSATTTPAIPKTNSSAISKPKGLFDDDDDDDDIFK